MALVRWKTLGGRNVVFVEFAPEDRMDVLPHGTQGKFSERDQLRSTALHVLHDTGSSARLRKAPDPIGSARSSSHQSVLDSTASTASRAQDPAVSSLDSCIASLKMVHL